MTLDAVQEAVKAHRLLMSYHYFRKTDLDRMVGKFAMPARIFADSGAYSASTLGAEIDVREYGNWLIKYRKHFSVIANLDVIGSAEKSYENLKILERMGLDPLPVYHTGEDWKWFDRYIDEYPYIALGGAVGYSASVLMPWAIKCFKRVRERNSSTVFHGFGLTNIKAITSLPWFSCDSSTWAQAYRWGKPQIWEPVQKKLIEVHVGDRPAVMKVSRQIQALGGDPGVIYDRSRYNWRNAASIASCSWRAMEHHLRRRHGDVPRADGKDVPGLHLYLADAAAQGNSHIVANHALARYEGLDGLTAEQLREGKIA